PALYLLTIIIAVATTLMTIIIPPIVGVPVFLICDFGPSSLRLCPNFKRRKKGMKIGDERTVIRKAIAIVMINTYIFTISPPLEATVHVYFDGSITCLTNDSNCMPRDALNKINVPSEIYVFRVPMSVSFDVKCRLSI